MEYIIRTTKIAVVLKGEPLFGERCTNISIEDHAAGEFIIVEQQSQVPGVKEQEIQIEPEEWPMLRDGIDMMIAEIKKHEPTDA